MIQNQQLIIDTSLVVCGLDIRYWQTIFAKHVDELRFKDKAIFHILERFARDEWEKVLLRDFLQLQEKKHDTSLVTERVSLARKVLSERQNVSNQYLRKKQEQKLLLPRLSSSGVLFTDNIKECLEPRQMVLKAKRNATLNYTDSKPSETSVNFTSEHHQDLFRKALTEIGYTAAVSIKSDSWGLYKKAKCNIPGNEDTKTDGCSKSKDNVTLLQTAFYKVDRETVTLSAALINELKVLGKEIERTNDVNQIQDRCESFLRKFGSHVNYSTVEFGGICQKRARGTHTDNSIDVRDGLGRGQQVEDYDMWAKGIKDNMDMWQVINRGKAFSTDFKAIWDLLIDHELDLQNVEQVRFELQDTWIHRFSHSLLSKRVRHVAQRLSQHKENEWQKDALEQIVPLYCAVVYTCLETGSNMYWKNILKYRRYVQNLLVYVSEIQENDEKAKYIKNLAAELVELSEQKSYKAGCLPPTLQGEIINDIPDMIKALQEVFVPQLVTDSQTEMTSQMHIAIMATKDLSLIFEHVKVILKRQNRYHELSLLVSMFNLLMTSSISEFGKVINPNDIEQTMENIRKCWKTFGEYKSSPVVQLEAYLIHLHLTTKQQFPDDVTVWNPLGSKLDDAFKEIIISSFRWEELVKILEEQKCVSSDVHHFSKDSQITEWQKLLDHLGLEKYLDEKISLEQVLTREYDTKNITQTDIPWVFLQKMILLDPDVMDHLANCIISETGKEADSYRHQNDDAIGATASPATAASTTDNDSDDDGNTNDSISDNDDDIGGFDEEEQKIVDPLDVFWSVFICCDLPLRQILVKKMHLCNFAVPLFFPLKSKDKLIYSLWPLRNITLGGDHFTGSLVNQPLNIVSFLRFRRPKFSKSNYLRSILRQQDEMFLSCEDADEERMAADGLIDCFVNTPTDEQKGTSTTQLMYLNLHGDAANHAYERQVEILGKVSDTVIACIDNADLADEEVVNAVKTLTGLPSQVIVLLQDRNIRALTKPKFKRLWEDFLSKIGKIKVKRVLGFQGNKDRNAIEIKDSIKEAILKSFEARKGKKLVDMPDIISAECIHIDEQDAKCLHTREQAEKVIASITKDRDVPGDEPPSNGFTAESGLTESGGIDNMPHRQTKGMSGHRTSELSFVEEFFFGLIDAFETKSIESYLSWLRILGDEQKQVENDRCGGVDISNTNVDILDLFQDVIEAYELKKSVKLPVALKDPFDKLPEVLAHLLLKGHPIPLLTDDMQRLPTNLIAGMFTYLDAILENKELSTMYVLGRPSDHRLACVGSMHGLIYPEGKSRNGLYLYLEKINDPTEKCTKYAVVMEMRGEPKMEKAFSLAVGLADIYILNCTEDAAKDLAFLQNIFQTLLQMKSFNMLKPTKQLFVIQEGNQRNVQLKEEMSSLIEQFTTTSSDAMEKGTLNDIIQFDKGKHVLNLPDSPKMDQVQDLRTTIFSDVVKSGSCLLRFSDFSNMLIDMWDAVTSEWSEVRFQNTHAAKALHIIQNHFSALQCALGCKSVYARPQQGGTELFVSVASQQHAMTDTTKLEVLSKIQNSPLPVKYLRLLKRYLNTVDSMLQHQDQRRCKVKAVEAQEVSNTI